MPDKEPKATGIIRWLDQINNALPLVHGRLSTTIRLLTDWVPVQVRRFLRITAMGVLTSWLVLGEPITWAAVLPAAVTAAQEVFHRAIAPATPDRESRQFRSASLSRRFGQ